jgi:protein-L-isoaspartate O-methyltransferase
LVGKRRLLNFGVAAFGAQGGAICRAGHRSGFLVTSLRLRIRPKHPQPNPVTMEDYSAIRKRMVDCQLRTGDVTDYAVLDAMGEIPRERFVPARMQSLAYIDEDLMVKEAEGEIPARYLMEPRPFARLVQLAEVKSSDIVLDIGCVAGYSTAVLARLADSVVGLEMDADLAALASENLVELGVANAAVVTGPLDVGYPSEGPCGRCQASKSPENSHFESAQFILRVL